MCGCCAASTGLSTAPKHTSVGSSNACQCAREAGALVLEIQSDPYAERFYRSLGAVPRGYVPSASIPGRELPLLEVELDGEG